MIDAKLTDSSGNFAARLATRAALLARAYGESLLRERHADSARWRRATLLWPLFTKDR
jgi:hypothetical protein